MRRLDFISGSPQLNIFKEGANKTNLGGALYLIYIIVLILLGIIYLFDYFSNDKYQFNYTLVETNFKDQKLMEDERMNSMLNTNLEFVFFLGKDNRKVERNIYNNNFIIIDTEKLSHKLKNSKKEPDGYTILNSTDISNNEECIIEQEEPQEKKAAGLSLAVLYRCNGTNCSIREEDIIKYTSYYFFVGYKGFSLEHQNSEKPIQPLPDDVYLVQEIQFLANTYIAYMNWELIEYEEERGVYMKTFDKIVGNNYTYYGGDFKSKRVYFDDGHVKRLPENDWKIKDLNGNHFTLLLYFATKYNDMQYEKYTRKKISFLDILANVSALASSVLNLMSLAYRFLYERNYDNYKIVENILTKKMNININNQRIIKENDEKSKIELKTDLIENNNSEENEKIGISINEDIQGEENNQEKGIKENLDLPAPIFFYFLFNKLYFKCFGHSSKQALIDSCNDIVTKYITIENILYNQIKLEYLWKDYKWNNPQNEIKQKDDLILNLKEK